MRAICWLFSCTNDKSLERYNYTCVPNYYNVCTTHIIYVAAWTNNSRSIKKCFM